MNFKEHSVRDLFYAVQACIWAGMTSQEIKDATLQCVQDTLREELERAKHIFKKG